MLTSSCTVYLAATASASMGITGGRRRSNMRLLGVLVLSPLLTRCRPCLCPAHGLFCSAAGSCARCCLAATSAAAPAPGRRAGAARSAAAAAGTLTGAAAMAAVATAGATAAAAVTGAAGVLTGAAAAAMATAAAGTPLQSGAHASHLGTKTAVVAAAAIMVVVAVATLLLQHTTRVDRGMVAMRHLPRTPTLPHSSI